MTTFEEARAIVFDLLSGDYPAEANFQVKTWGWENDTHYQLVAMPANFDYVAPANGPYITVEKATGECKLYYGRPYELPNGSPIGENHPDLED